MAKFTFYWRSGKREVLEGTSQINAFEKAGYTHASVGGLSLVVVGDDNSYNFKNFEWIKKEDLNVKTTSAV